VAIDAVPQDGYIVEIMRGGYLERVVVDKATTLVMQDGPVCLRQRPD